MCIEGYRRFHTVIHSPPRRRAVERKTASTSRTVEDFVANSLEMEFSDFDAEYYSATPTVIEILERLLENQTDTFVQIVD